MKIIITEVDPEYSHYHCRFYTHIDGRLSAIAGFGNEVGHGNSEREAIGDLVKNYPHLFDIEIERNKEAAETKPQDNQPKVDSMRENIAEIKKLKAEGKNVITDDAGWLLASFEPDDKKS